MFNNIPDVKLGIIAVSRDCFIVSLSENRRKAIVEAYTKQYGEIFEAQTVVESICSKQLKKLKLLAVML